MRRFLLACLLYAGCGPGEEKDTLRAPEDTDVVGDCEGPTVLGYLDADADGYGDPEHSLGACTLADGYVEDATDCDDADAAIHPSAEEADCADPVDYNCDGSTGYTDADVDGVPACEECDDTDPTVLPGADETCDGRDEDCDGAVDEDAVDPTTWYLDADEDGYGRDVVWSIACEPPSGYTAVAGDCDDTDAAVSPDAVERCDTDDIDEDCDGAADDADDDLVEGGAWYLDEDGDGYGDDAGLLSVCDPPGGYVASGGDCDDGDPAVHPGADEVCDASAEDEDCDGLADDDDPSVTAASRESWFTDADDDGYGADAIEACAAPAGTVARDGDCDDGDSAISPAALEVCDDADTDEDCDGTADGPGASGEASWWRDRDGDSYGDESVQVTACDAPSGYVSATAPDCDDTESATWPDAPDSCGDGVDSDCAGDDDSCGDTGGA